MINIYCPKCSKEREVNRQSHLSSLHEVLPIEDTSFGFAPSGQFLINLTYICPHCSTQYRLSMPIEEVKA